MDMDQEIKILLHCLRGETGNISPSLLQGLSISDWENVIKASITHGVTPLLYQRLEVGMPAKIVDGKVLDRFHKIYLKNAAMNMRRYNELSKVLRMLQDDGISVIVLKGAHLAEIVYGNIALRPMSDMDLMVKRADLPEVAEKFLKMGYRSNKRLRNEGLSSALQKPSFTDFHNNNFDIHWTIDNGAFKIDVDSLWEQAQSVTVAGVKARALSPEDLLLYIAVHASFHHTFDYRLRSLCDISQTIWHYRDEMDWEQVLLRARQWGADRCLYLMLYLADELLETPVPDSVMDALKPQNFDGSMAALAKRMMFDDQATSSQLSLIFSRLLRYSRFRDKAKYFLTRVFPPREAIASMYPAHPRSMKIYLYYPVHLKDLLLRNRRTAWKLLFRDKKMMASAQKENTLRDWITAE